jgi:hypothetical protein
MSKWNPQSTRTTIHQPRTNTPVVPQPLYTSLFSSNPDIEVSGLDFNLTKCRSMETCFNFETVGNHEYTVFNEFDGLSEVSADSPSLKRTSDHLDEFSQSSKRRRRNALLDIPIPYLSDEDIDALCESDEEEETTESDSDFSQWSTEAQATSSAVSPSIDGSALNLDQSWESSWSEDGNISNILFDTTVSDVDWLYLSQQRFDGLEDYWVNAPFAACDTEAFYSCVSGDLDLDVPSTLSAGEDGAPITAGSGDDCDGLSDDDVLAILAEIEADQAETELQALDNEPAVSSTCVFCEEVSDLEQPTCMPCLAGEGEA